MFLFCSLGLVALLEHTICSANICGSPLKSTRPHTSTEVCNFAYRSGVSDKQLLLLSVHAGYLYVTLGIAGDLSSTVKQRKPPSRSGQVVLVNLPTQQPNRRR